MHDAKDKKRNDNNDLVGKGLKNERIVNFVYD